MNQRNKQLESGSRVLFYLYFVFTFRRLQLQTVVTEATLAGSLKTGFLIEWGNTRILKLFHLDSSL